MMTKCPHCNTLQKAPDDATGREALCKSCRQLFEIAPHQNTPQNPSRLAVMILITIIGTALGWTTGFFCGAILTKPNRQKVDAEIADIQNTAQLKVNAARNIAAKALAGTPAITPDTNGTNDDLAFLVACSEACARILTTNLMVVASQSQPTEQRLGVLQVAVVVLKQEVSVVAELTTADSQLRQLQDGVVQWADACYNVYAYGLGLLTESDVSSLSKLDDLIDKVRPAAQLAGALLGAQKYRFGVLPEE